MSEFVGIMNILLLECVRSFLHTLLQMRSCSHSYKLSAKCGSRTNTNSERERENEISSSKMKWIFMDLNALCQLSSVCKCKCMTQKCLAMGGFILTFWKFTSVLNSWFTLFESLHEHECEYIRSSHTHSGTWHTIFMHMYAFLQRNSECDEIWWPLEF